MVKVLTGVQPGQVTDAQAEVIAGAPVTELQDQTPQAEPVSFKEWLNTPSPVAEDVTAGVGEAVAEGIAVEEQRAREAVPDIITRREEAPTRVDEWQTQAADDANTGEHTDGGLAARATNMANAYTTGGYGLAGLASKHGGAAKQIAETTGALTPEGTLDRGFLQMMSVITENSLAELAFSEGVEGVQQEGVTDPTELQGQNPVTKAQGNKNLGQAIHRDYQRYKAAQEGRPTDEYTDLSPEQATILGDMAKEMYYEANKEEAGKQFIVRGTAPDGQVAFTLTKHGADRLRAGAFARKQMFPKKNVRPAKTPLPKGRLVGEGRKVTQRVAGRTGKITGDSRILNEAMVNLNTVANVVDKQRLKILLATALPVLQEKVDASHPFAVINHVGQDKIDKLTAANPDTVAEEYAGLVNDLAQSMFGIATERNGANYLTYYAQAFNGRIAPQQTNFDPTTSKTTRFVTRNAVPADTGVPRIERNLRQMYAMMLVKGADALLPEGRETALENATPQLLSWGRELKQALSGITDQQVEAVANAIATGVALTDPNFPQLPDVSQQVSPELGQAIAKKGEDGQHFIDGLIDFVDYIEGKQRGKPHRSYFNAYMDGKTNGLAANGIQMGSENVAYKTGVIRSQDEYLLDDNVDIRDDLKNVLLASLDDGFEGTIGPEMTGPLHRTATKVYAIRDLNKATTMTFGYGKELDSFKQDIDEWMAIAEQADPELADDVVYLSTAMGGRDKLVQTLHGKYVGGLANALDPNALASRSIMRAAAYTFALTNEVFTIPSAIGTDIVMGGTEVTGEQGSTEYGIRTPETTDRPLRRKAIEYGTEVTSSAVKERVDPETGEVSREVGGYAYGGAVPAPVQSLDAATVALTSSGKSWDRLKANSAGAPYLHTIYDAFKVDAMGYDVVLDEVNKNWLNASMDWSYLEETEKALANLRKTFAEKYSASDAARPLTDGEKRQLVWFMEMEKTKQGMKPLNLENKMGKIIADPEGGEAAASRIIEGMGRFDPARATVGDLRKFMGLFNQEVKLAPRLGSMINTTNKNKKKLAEKIRRDGVEVYQYYAH